MPVIAALAFACAWLVTALLDAMRAPDWAIFTGGAVIVASIAAVIAALHLWAQDGNDGNRGSGHHGTYGGGPWREPPDAPDPDGGDGTRDWWPEFEHQLASHLAARELETLRL